MVWKSTAGYIPTLFSHSQRSYLLPTGGFLVVEFIRTARIFSFFSLDLFG